MNRTITVRLALIVLCLVSVLSSGSAWAKGAALERQLAASVTAKGAEYVAVRESIISKKAEFLPVLKSKLNDSDWHVRVVARAIVGHIEDPQTYARCEERTMTMGGPWLFHGLSSFYSATRGTPFNPEPGRKTSSQHAYVRRQYREASWPWFLAEIALKDSVLTRPIRDFQLPDDDSERLYTKDQVAVLLQVSQETADLWMHSPMMRVTEGGNGEKQVNQEDLTYFAKTYLKPNSSTEYRETVRCWAMMTLSSFSDNPVVIPLLTELLQSHESTKIRGYAALALGASGDPGAVEPLSKATDDPDSQVKEAAQRSLSRLYEIIEELKK